MPTVKATAIIRQRILADDGGTPTQRGTGGWVNDGQSLDVSADTFDNGHGVVFRKYGATGWLIDHSTSTTYLLVAQPTPPPQPIEPPQPTPPPTPTPQPNVSGTIRVKTKSAAIPICRLPEYTSANEIGYAEAGKVYTVNAQFVRDPVGVMFYKLADGSGYLFGGVVSLEVVA